MKFIRIDGDIYNLSQLLIADFQTSKAIFVFKDINSQQHCIEYDKKQRIMRWFYSFMDDELTDYLDLDFVDGLVEDCSEAMRRIDNTIGIENGEK